MLRRTGLGARLTALLLLLGLVAIAGCGDDSAKPAATTTPPTSTAAAAAATTVRPASGTPIKVGGIFGLEGPAGTPQFPEILAGVKGAIASINKNGGVNGRPIELVSCPDKGDANVAAACGRQMVSENVIAIVGSAGRFSANWFPITEPAGIPFIGPPIGAPEQVSPLSFPNTQGSPGFNIGAGAIAVDVGKAKKVTVAIVDLASSVASVEAIDPILQLRGATVQKVRVPLNAPDMSSYAASILATNPDAVYMAMTQADADKMTLAIRQTGSKVTLVRSAATFPQSSIQTLGANAEGILVASQAKSVAETNDPEVKQFLAELKDADSNAIPTELAQQAWSAVYTFADAAKQASTLDAAGLRAVLESGKSFAAPILAGQIQFKAPVAAAKSARAFNVMQTFTKVSGGKLVTANDNKFIDPYVAPKPA
jgi:branched-chain amino acid transport system substrate-binding protein